MHTILLCLHFHWPASPRLHTLYYFSQALAYDLNTHIHTRFFSASTVLFLALSTAYTFLPVSPTQPHSNLRNHSKKRSLLPFPHVLSSHAFSAPSQQCTYTVWCGGWGRKGGGEVKLGAQGHSWKTRTWAKRYEEIGGSGVVHGEQCYLINTNAWSKLFRQASNIPFSLACAVHETDEPIRWDQIRSDQIQSPVGVYTLTHTHTQI